MRKVIVLILMLAVLSTAVFAGGGGDRGGFRVDVFWFHFADPYTTSVRNSMSEEFQRAGIAFQHHDCNLNQTTQAQMVQSAITRGTSLLIVNIVTTGSEDAAMNIVNMARRANIPLLFFNREVSNNVIRSYANSAFVGTDADEAGYMQGEGIAKFLLRPDNWVGNRSRFDLNGDGQISYVMLRGEHGNPEAFGRTKYSVEEANRQLAGRLRLVPSPANQTSTQYDNDGISNFFLYANWSAAEAANLMRTALAAHSLTTGAIELIIANNDDAALGAIEAMNEQGFNRGDATRYIPVFGVDAITTAVEAIRGGRMTGTVLQDAVGMAKAIVYLTENVRAGRALLDGVDDRFNMDRGVAKIRIPYTLVE